MDPWLESRGIFPDLHNRLIALLSEAIAGGLKPPYYSAIATRVYLEEGDREVEPDIDVFESAVGISEVADFEGGVAVATEVAAKPIIVRVTPEDVSEWTLEIRNAADEDRLVTSIEILSRSNKTRGGKGRRLYLQKRREMIRGRVNVVEIDLLRGGIHTTVVPRARAVKAAGPFSYHVCVRRAWKPFDLELYSVRMFEPLPRINIPLLKRDPDVSIELQPLLSKCYEIGSYGIRVKYDRPPDPPLLPEQAKWASEVLAKARSS